MGLIEKLKDNFDYYKLDKYTRRRLSQSQFESHDRRYYETVYRDGDYINPTTQVRSTPSRSHLSYKQSRWSIHELWRKGSNNKTVAATQLRISETYTLGRA